MSYTTDSDAYDQNVSPYLRRRTRTYDEALSERQAARKDVHAAITAESMRGEAVRRPYGQFWHNSQPVSTKPGPASRPAPHDAQSEADHRSRRTLAGPLAMSDCAPPAAATAQETRQPATTAPREQNGERDAR